MSSEGMLALPQLAVTNSSTQQVTCPRHNLMLFLRARHLYVFTRLSDTCSDHGYVRSQEYQFQE